MARISHLRFQSGAKMAVASVVSFIGCAIIPVNGPAPRAAANA